MISKSELQTRANELQKTIDSGKLKGEKLRLARKRYSALTFRIRHFNTSKTDEQLALDKVLDITNAKLVKMKLPVATKATKAQPVTTQGILPGFLENVNARIEEMIVQLIFDRLSAKIDAKVDEVFGGKKHG